MYKIDHKPLPFEDYDKFGIDQRYSALILRVDNICQEEADQVESDYIQRGYKLFHSDMEQVKEGHFKLTLILAKLNYIF